MPTQPYLIDGVRVPGTTTIISRFKESGALIYWAWDLGKQGLDYRKVRDDAANAGTAAHAMVEADIRGKEFNRDGHPPEILAKADNCFGAYKEWKEQTQLQPLETELPLISKKYRYGGTLDVMLIRGKRSLGDFKTANAVYADNLLQLAAYGQLWRENYPDQPIDGGYHLLRFSKSGDLETRWWGDLSEALEAFLLMRQLYDYDKKLKARI